MHQTDPKKPAPGVEGSQPSAPWSYEEAFSRNRGLVTPAEQQKLRESRVAIAGMGGVGGVHLMTLVRLGIGRFTIADPDVFELANFNRQFGATIHTLGRNKAEVMGELALAVNPELQIRIIPEPVTAQNVDSFLHEADVFLDGLDFFELEARRVVFAAARRLGIWALTAGPIGMSVAWLVFDPRGMSFEDYFDFDATGDPLSNLVAFATGLSPKSAHAGYIDLSAVDVRQRRGPSSSAACELCAGVAATEILKLLSSKGAICRVPAYSQFDAFTHRLKRGRLLRGNRGLLQRAKRAWLKHRFAGRV
jgi:molybdopterin/thiamine biosynthesis adenylyltransferase